METIILVSLICYVIIVILISANGKVNSYSNFSIGNKKVGILPTIGSLSSGFRDGAGIAVWITLAVYYGFGALWLTAGLSTGLLLLSLLSRKIHTEGLTNSYINIQDYIRNKYGRLTEAASGLIVFFTSLLYSAVQLYAASIVISTIFSLSLIISTVLVSIAVLSYLLISGYSAVVKTDTFQWIIILAIIVLPFMSNIEFNTLSNIPKLSSPGLSNAFGLAAISFLVVVSGGDVWQRLFSSTNHKSARTAFALTIPIYLLISIALIIFGYFISTVTPNGLEGNAITNFITNGSSSIIVKSTFILFFIVACLSTLDTQSFLFANTYANNFHRSKNKIRVTKIALVFLFFVLVLVSLTVHDIVEFLFGAVTLSTVLAPVLLIPLFNKHYTLIKGIDTKITITLFASVILYVILFAGGYFDNIMYTLAPAIFQTALMLGIYLFGKK